MLMEFLLFLVLVLQCDLMTSENTQKHVRMTLNPTYISFNLRKSTRNLSLNLLIKLANKINQYSNQVLNAW